MKLTKVVARCVTPLQTLLWTGSTLSRTFSKEAMRWTRGSPCRTRVWTAVCLPGMWARTGRLARRPTVGLHQDLGSLQDWTLHATFEIEACDVPCREVSRHTEDLPTIKNILRTKPARHFVVLYTAAHDRAWDKRKTDRAPADIEKRRWRARESGAMLEQDWVAP